MKTSHANAGFGRRIKAIVAAVVLAAGLALPLRASAQTTEPVPSATSSLASASSAGASAGMQDNEDVIVPSSSGKSPLSRSKTLGALVLAAALALAAAIFAFVRAGRDNWRH